MAAHGNGARRSTAALTLTRHLEFDDAGVNILLHPSDTKAKRAETSEGDTARLSWWQRVRCILGIS
jgi:hypothetical protein